MLYSEHFTWAIQMAGRFLWCGKLYPAGCYIVERHGQRVLMTAGEFQGRYRFFFAR